MITVYTQPNCMPCRATKRALDAGGHGYVTVDLSESDEATDFVKILGHQQAPVVHVSDDIHWSGFRPDLIKRLRTS